MLYVILIELELVVHCQSALCSKDDVECRAMFLRAINFSDRPDTSYIPYSANFW